MDTTSSGTTSTAAEPHTTSTGNTAEHVDHGGVETYNPATGETTISPRDGSGQIVGSGGTASALPAIMPAAPAIDDAVMRDAAMTANRQPAPSDPLAQQLAAMETRVRALEQAAESTAGARTNIEADVAALVKHAENSEPLLARIKHLFDVHWAGKFPDPTA